jgi:putative hydrolase of the HAD superfamily
VAAVLLFDLDDTLVVEEAATVAALDAAAQLAADRHGISPNALAGSAREHARALWYATPLHEHCLRIGISSWEGLWCRFEGDDPRTRWLRDWSPSYRHDAWRLALADERIDDPSLCDELAERFAAERRARHWSFDDAAPALSALGLTHELALVTNGASCLQREKLEASGLSDQFAAVVVSADVGVGKPHVAIFHHVLAQLGCDSGSAVMVGDSLERDVRGALDAGLGAVWLNRSGRQRTPDCGDVPQVRTLLDLPAALTA